MKSRELVREDAGENCFLPKATDASGNGLGKRTASIVRQLIFQSDNVDPFIITVSNEILKLEEKSSVTPIRPERGTGRIRGSVDRVMKLESSAGNL